MFRWHYYDCRQPGEHHWWSCLLEMHTGSNPLLAWFCSGGKQSKATARPEGSWKWQEIKRPTVVLLTWGTWWAAYVEVGEVGLFSRAEGILFFKTIQPGRNTNGSTGKLFFLLLFLSFLDGSPNYLALWNRNCQKTVKIKGLGLF